MIRHRRPVALLFALFVIAAVGLPAYPAAADADTKRGAASGISTRANSMNARWIYNWSNTPFSGIEDGTFHGEYVPMIWSAGTAGVQSNHINKILSYADDLNVKHVLGFNEPERSQQANMTVTQAINVWDIMTDGFAGSGIELVSPAVSGIGGINDWLTPFMSEVNTRNNDANANNDLQVDAIAFHWYGTGGNPIAGANNLLGYIDDLWADYGRPIWLTEFAGVDFSGTTPTETKVQYNNEFLDYIIPKLESRSHVERYAWWQFNVGGKPYSKLVDSSAGVYTPTTIGDAYVGTLDAGVTTDLNGQSRGGDFLYLQGGTITNTGASLGGEGVQQIYVLTNDDGSAVSSSIGGSSGKDWGVSRTSNGGTVRTQANTTLRKVGGNRIQFQDAELVIDGEVRLMGTSGPLADVANTGSELWIHGSGTTASGSGFLRVDPGSNLRLGKSNDVDGLSLPYEMRLYGGDLRISGSQVVLTGPMPAFADTNIDIDAAANVTIDGVISNTGNIVKQGSGTLFLRGASTHSGTTKIQQGNVLVANSIGSATGSSPVQVASGGTLGGIGSIAGPVSVQSGGTLAPGLSQGNVNPAPPPATGAVVNAIDFDFAGVQDSAPLSHTSTLSPALELVSGFDFGPGVNPRGNSNNGNEFNVAGFSTEGAWSFAHTTDDYLTFTVDPVPGLAMILDDVTYELRRNGTGAARNYRVVTSIDGFNYPGRLTPDLSIPESDTSTRIFTASYGGSEAVTDPVEVRIYGWNAASGTGNTHFYNVSLDASFISEPNHIALEPTGILELGGSYTQLDFATLAIEIGGSSNADPTNAQFDQLMVGGNVSLDGTLDVSFIDGYLPDAGNAFDILTSTGTISGVFDSELLPGLSGGLFLDLEYGASELSLTVDGVLGDYNYDGVVDAADFSVWRDSLGQSGMSLAADGDRSGSIDNGDYLVWQNNFGATSNNAINAQQLVPEPSGLLLALLAFLAICHIRR